MKVTVIRSGGFAGIERRGEGDTDHDAVLRRLVQRVDLSAVPPPGRIPDQFTYEIQIGGDRTVVGEARLTGPLRELIRHVLN